MMRRKRKRKRRLEKQLQQQQKHLKAKHGFMIGKESGSLAPVTPTESTEKVARLIAVKTLGRPSVLKTLLLNILFFLFLGTTVVSSSAVSNMVVSSSGGNVVASAASLRIARQLPLLMSAHSTSRKPTASPTPVTSASGRASTVKPSTMAVEMSLHATVSAIR